MAATLRIAVPSGELDRAKAAANWLSSFHPDVSVTMEAEALSLASAKRDCAALSLLWNLGLANERLHEGARQVRTEVLAELVR